MPPAHSGDVSRRQVEPREQWRQRITQQEKRGQSIRAFCRERGLGEPGFYAWRQRLRKENTLVRFALVEAKPAEETSPPIELMLASGDRLCIPHDAAALRLVLRVLREQA